jgi:hypothetical protein
MLLAGWTMAVAAKAISIGKNRAYNSKMPQKKIF